MAGYDKKSLRGEHIDWGTIADLRYLRPNDVSRIASIQGSLDFDRPVLDRAHADRPTRFVPRIAKEDELLRAWEGENGTLFRAPWRSGKTEMVLSLIERSGLHERFLFVSGLDKPYPGPQYGTLDEFRRVFGVREIVAHVAAIRQRAGESAPPGSIEAELSAFVDSGQSPFAFVSHERSSRRLPPALVALDEVAVFGYDPEQLGYLATLKDETHLRVCMIVQRAPALDQRYGVAFTGFTSIYLEPLTIAEVAQVATTKAALNDLRLSTLALCEMKCITGGRPLDVTALVETCARFVQQGRLSPVITRGILGQVARGEIAPLEGTPLEPLITNYIRVFEVGLTDAEKELVLAAIGSSSGVPRTESSCASGDDLVRYGILAVKDQVYYINGQLLEEAILKRMTSYRNLNYWVPDEYGNDYPA
jgi:hypothetical protein